MILLVVPLGFSTGTELLKTRAQSSQTDFPMVNLDPPDSEKQTDRQCVDEGKYLLKKLLEIVLGDELKPKWCRGTAIFKKILRDDLDIQI